MDKRICSVEGCEGDHEARGLCNRHYHSLRRYGDPLFSVLPPRRSTCSVDGCTSKHSAKGLCVSHYSMERNSSRRTGPIYKGRLRAWIFVKDQMATRPRDTGCWDDWPYFAAEGRPVIFVAEIKRVTNLARYVRRLEDGTWPQLACHHCDNPACWNPDHIYAGTPASNTADMVKRGRGHWQRPAS